MLLQCHLRVQLVAALIVLDDVGSRFLDDVADQIEALALPRHRLVRVR